MTNQSTPDTQTIIIWFRQDLRLSDNPALHEAAKRGAILPVFILDDINAGEFAPGSASRWWLHHSLTNLNHSLDDRLMVYKGDAGVILPEIAKVSGAHAVYWNQCYEPWRVERDERIVQTLKSHSVAVKTFNGSLLWEPWQTLKKDGSPYKVFTHFYRKGCLAALPPRKPLRKPARLKLISDIPSGFTIDDLDLLPKIKWYQKLEAFWSIGEQGAQKQLRRFIKQGLKNYKDGRNYPAQNNVSRLSPHLHFGELSPNQVWYAAKDSQANVPEADLDCFLSELGWREFSNSLLFHYPDLPRKNLNIKFNHFPWTKDIEVLNRWQQGQTGYPIVDAGMRELRQTGYIHNRVRMVVGSFLVKNLLLHWRHGETWFWDNLLDADLANNSASWQWVAGCGADAAPYFRIFNPVTQGQKFDPQGEYTIRFVPELARLPIKYLFNPWNAPAEVLRQADVRLGDNYPEPIVDVKLSRERALAAFAELKKVNR